MNVGVNDGDLNPQAYMDRLKVLRAKCGLDNSPYDPSQGKALAPDGVADNPPTSSQLVSSSNSQFHIIAISTLH